MNPAIMERAAKLDAAAPAAEPKPGAPGAAEPQEKGGKDDGKAPDIRDVMGDVEARAKAGDGKAKEGAEGEEGAEGKPEPKEGQEKQEARKLKMVVNGEEVLMAEKDVVQLAQKALGAEKKFLEANQTRRQVEAIFKNIQKSPDYLFEEVLPALGMDPQKYAEDFLFKKLQWEKMSPEQREAEENKKKIRQYEDEKKAASQRAEREKFEKLTTHYRGEYEKGIIEALEKGGVPKSKSTVRRMAHYMAQALEKGISLKPIDVVALVREDIQNEIREITEMADPDHLMGVLGENVTNKIREAQLKRLNPDGTPASPARKTGTETPTAPKDDKVIGIDEFRERLKRKLG